jgi:R3H domain
MDKPVEVVTKLLHTAGFASVVVHQGVLPILGTPMVTVSGCVVAPSQQSEFEYSVQFLTRMILGHHDESNDDMVLIDFDGKLVQRIREIETQSKFYISRAQGLQVPIQVPPMNGLERKILHTLVQQHSDLVTESVGVGPDRHIVILPADKK